MEKEKQRQVFRIRKLQKKDEEEIMKCYREFDNLHFNPIHEDFIGEILIYGQFWGVFHKEQLVACTFLLPAKQAEFQKLNAYWEVCDLLNDSLEDYMLRGYVWRKKEYQTSEIYSAICKLWNIQTAKSHKYKLLYCIPSHVWFSMQRLFEEGFLLIGLRGLDNLVPHYIFTKDVALKQSSDQNRNIVKCRMSDTKTISKLCEHKYKGFNIGSDKNIMFYLGDDTFDKTKVVGKL